MHCDIVSQLIKFPGCFVPYSKPVAQSRLTEIFFVNGIFSRHSVVTGKIQIKTSLFMLNKL
jgi:hypothetical protein